MAFFDGGVDMAFLESLVTNIILEIGKKAGGKAWKSAARKDKVIKILKAVGLKPGRPEPDFESVYAYTLVEYGVEQPAQPILELFRHEDIRQAFRTSFETDDSTILSHEAGSLIDWSKLGDDLRHLNIDPRLEFVKFSLLFTEMVTQSLTAGEIRQDLKLNKILHYFEVDMEQNDRFERKLNEVLQLIKAGDENAIRTKTLEMIQGSLEKQLKDWFTALGYSLAGHNIQTDEYCEWIVKIPGRRGFDSILVRCIERQAEEKHLMSLKQAIEQHQTDEGWLIATHRKSPSAGKMADQEKRIFCYTLDELLDEQADFRRYVEWLDSFVKEQRIDKDYVPLACRRDLFDSVTKEKTGEERYGKEQDWIEGYIDRWLEDPCMEHISILGEFGTGKTWFTHSYAYRILQTYLEAKKKGKKRPRVPLVIHLRDYAKTLNIESLFSDFFFHKHEIPLPGYSCFEQLNRMGKLLLIFDGFDEMADKLDRQKMINNFWEIARVVVPGAKVILTCRTEHFPDAKEGRTLLNAELNASIKYLTGDPPQFEILDLEKFDEGQIRAALLKRTGLSTVELIMDHPELLDLASRPVMLEFILEAIPDIEDGSLIDLSRIYLYAIRRKLDRDVKSDRTFTSIADKLYFMCELSWEMLTTEKMSLNYKLFPDRLQNMFGSIVAEQKDLDYWQYDMMGNNLMIRNDEGDYTPAHRSLLEFFVAIKITAELGLLPEDFTEIARNKRVEDIDDSRAPKEYTWSEYFRRDLDEHGEIQRDAPLKSFAPNNRDIILRALGHMGEAVLRFIYEITNIEEVRSRFYDLFAKVFDEFKASTREPEEQQEIITLILRFRALSQKWEVQTGRGDEICRFWKARLVQERDAAKGKTEVKTFYINRGDAEPIGIEMALLPTGSFLMGDELEQPIHRVDISRPFMISMMPVTQALYKAVTGVNPSESEDSELPKENISWFDAVRFCNELSEKLSIEPGYNIDGKRVEWNKGTTGFRLPTEAEWEYACRAGTTTAFACGDLETDLERMGWFDNNSDMKIQPIGRKEPNGWRLFDMHGNVWEWVWDFYGKYSAERAKDPIGATKGSKRVLRGGSWFDEARVCRSAIRFSFSPEIRNFNIGFRLARSVG